MPSSPPELVLQAAVPLTGLSQSQALVVSEASGRQLVSPASCPS